mmetsp:Transcript_14158/g.19656  ORF Transcript_14158/g.19656 Transcript_14158/m.19656 type:complete len:294 (-) Transcript_14158:422-1303(-)
MFNTEGTLRTSGESKELRELHRKQWNMQAQRGHLPDEIVANDMVNTLTTNGRMTLPRGIVDSTQLQSDKRILTTVSINSDKADGKYVVDTPAGLIRNVEEVRIINMCVPNPFIRVNPLNAILHFRYLITDTQRVAREENFSKAMFSEWTLRVPNGDYLSTKLVDFINKAIDTHFRPIMDRHPSTSTTSNTPKFVFERNSTELNDAYSVQDDGSVSGANSIVFKKRQDASIKLINSTSNVNILVPSEQDMQQFLYTYSTAKFGSLWSTLGFPLDAHARVLRSAIGAASNVPRSF